MQNLKAYTLMNRFNDLSAKECGALQGAFLNEFLFWNLFINTHAFALCQGTSTLYAIRAYSDESESELSANDQGEMIRFIEGFVAGLRSIRKKKPFWGG